MTEKKLSDIEKLRVLLPHWLEHNKSHGAEFCQWAEIISGADDPTATSSTSLTAPSGSGYSMNNWPNWNN